MNPRLETARNSEPARRAEVSHQRPARAVCHEGAYSSYAFRGSDIRRPMGTHDLRVRLAQIAQREGRPHEAATLYAQVLRGNPYLVEAWCGLSQTVSESEQALYCLKRVLALNPCHTGARRQLE
jgi:hypothetical protein